MMTRQDANIENASTIVEKIQCNLDRVVSDEIVVNVKTFLANSLRQSCTLVLSLVVKDDIIAQFVLEEIQFFLASS